MHLGPKDVVDEIQKLQWSLVETRKKLEELHSKVEPVEIEDYTLTSASGEKVKLSQMFGDKSDLLVVHNMGSFCSYCTLWADGFNGITAYLQDRAGFVLVSSDGPDKLRGFSEKRGWKFP